MRIITCNVNGVRSAASKGFFEWMKRQKPDLACLQEIKAQESDLPRELLAPKGMHGFFHPAEKRGYSGVAIYSRHEPDKVTMGLGIKEIDAQGRFLQLDLGALSVISLYMPSGTMGDQAQQRKYAFMDRFLPRLEEMRKCAREFVICGDWNIAHREIDVKNWKRNQTMTGFLPREREWLTRVLEEHGFVDVFRALDPSEDRFTWWVPFANARQRNIGWRIDYQIATPGIAKKATKASIYTQEIFTDHAPVVIDYDFSLSLGRG
ncbi:MAG TPA: exodeoxyribonuclease III [Usitatibacter sp.]|nr:exodeoxyribonuclease III [Usitatibacter sp.]